MLIDWKQPLARERDPIVRSWSGSTWPRSSRPTTTWSTRSTAVSIRSGNDTLSTDRSGNPGPPMRRRLRERRTRRVRQFGEKNVPTSRSWALTHRTPFDLARRHPLDVHPHDRRDPPSPTHELPGRPLRAAVGDRVDLRLASAGPFSRGSAIGGEESLRPAHPARRRSRRRTSRISATVGGRSRTISAPRTRSFARPARPGWRPASTTPRSWGTSRASGTASPRPNVIVDLDVGANETVLILAHYDVVPVPDRAARPLEEPAAHPYPIAPTAASTGVGRTTTWAAGWSPRSRRSGSSPRRPT